MSQSQSPQQPFEALCELASRESWCWKLTCTTCGHMLFRYGLRQLALGNRPDGPSWLVHSSHPVLRRGSPLNELGPVPPLGGWPKEEQRRLQSILKTANPVAIASRCSWPDWLGYMGLALHYTEDVESESHELTSAWAPKLSTLVLPESPAAKMLAFLGKSEHRALTWRDMETVEQCTAR